MEFKYGEKFCTHVWGACRNSYAGVVVSKDGSEVVPILFVPLRLLKDTKTADKGCLLKGNVTVQH